MKQLVELKVNGEIYELAVEPRRTLLEVLRENLGFTPGPRGVVIRGSVVPGP